MDDFIGRHSLGLGLEVRAQSVTKNGYGDPLDIFDRNVESTVHGGHRFAGLDEKLTRSRSCSKVQQLFDNLRSIGLTGPSGADQSNDVLDHKRAHGYGIDQFLNVQNRPGRKHLGNLRFLTPGGRRENPFLFVGCGIADFDVEHKTV